MDVPTMFQRSVDRTPDRLAYSEVNGDEAYTYAELATEVNRTANGLASLGVETGDRVTTCLPNRTDHGIVYLATQLLGAVFVPFNFRLAAADVTYHVEDSDPTVFVFDDVSREAVTTAAGDLACDTILYVGEDAPEFADPLSSQRGPDTDVSTDVSDDDLSALLYTSGTTGEPKGVPITHEAAVARVLSNTIGQRYYMGETVLSAMPMYHTIGLHGVFSTMLCTSGTYLTQATFDPVGYVEALEAHPVTGVYEAPTIFNNVLNHDRMADADVDQVPHVIYGGAPMSSALADMVKDVFEPEHMIHLYGNTEMYDPLAYADPMKYGGQGLFHRVRVVEFGTNDPAATVERGEEGELVVHTDAPAAFDGYWRKPDETEAAVTDGWFFTGDSAYKDDEGHVMITGRADDLIISGGENIHPVEVEDVLAAHEAVADVAVVGTQDEEWGETVVAYVQPGPDADVTAAALEEWCLGRDDLAAFKRPREYQFVDDIPRNPSGKIMRYKLRERED